MLTTSELIYALKLAPEDPELCREAAYRVRAGSMNPKHLPASYDPAVYVIPQGRLDP